MKKLKVVKRTLASGLAVALLISQMGTISFADSNEFQNVRMGYDESVRTYNTHATMNKADGAEENTPDDGEIPVDPSPVDPSPVDPSPVDPSLVDPSPVDPSPVDPSPVDTEDDLLEDESEIMLLDADDDDQNDEETKENYYINYGEENQSKVDSDKVTFYDTFSNVKAAVSNYVSNDVSKTFSKEGHTLSVDLEDSKTTTQIEGVDATYKVLNVVYHYEPITYEYTFTYGYMSESVFVPFTTGEGENVKNVTETKSYTYGSTIQLNNNTLFTIVEGDVEKYYMYDPKEITLGTTTTIDVECKELVKLTYVVENVNYDPSPEKGDSIDVVYLFKHKSPSFEEGLEKSKFSNSKLNTTYYDLSNSGWNVTRDQSGVTPVSSNTEFKWTGTTIGSPYKVEGNSNKKNFQAYYNSNDAKFTLSPNWWGTFEIEDVTSYPEGTAADQKIIISNTKLDKTWQKAQIDLNGNSSAKLKVTFTFLGNPSSSYFYLDHKNPTITDPVTDVTDWYYVKTYSFTAVDKGDNDSGIANASQIQVSNVDAQNISYDVSTGLCTVKITQNGTYTITVTDNVGNVTTKQFTENNIPTESASTFIQKLDFEGNTVDATENCQNPMWFGPEENVYVNVKPATENESPVTNVSISIKDNADGTEVATATYTETITGDGVSIPMSTFKGVDGKTYRIEVTATNEAGLTKTYNHYVKCDATAPVVGTVTFPSELEVSHAEVNNNLCPAPSYENLIALYAEGEENVAEFSPVRVRGNFYFHAASNGYHKSSMVLNIPVSDKGAGLKTLTVSGFSVASTVFIVDLINNTYTTEDGKTRDDETLEVTGNGCDATVVITLYNNDLTKPNSDITIKATDRVGNTSIYDFGEEANDVHILDGINPVGTVSVLENGKERVLNNSEVEIATGKVEVIYTVTDKNLFRINDDGQQEELNYQCSIKRKDDPNAEEVFLYESYTFQNPVKDLTSDPQSWNGKIVVAKGVEFKEDGLYTIRYVAKDAANLDCKFGEETQAKVSFYYDITNPEVSLEAVEEKWVNTDVVMNGVASDAKWGKVTEVYYAKDNNETFNAPESEADAKASYKNPTYTENYDGAQSKKGFTVTASKEEDFNGYYHFWTYDTAGNVSEVKSVHVQIDSTKPAAELSVKNDIVYNKDVDVDVNAKEIKEAGLNSGLFEIAYEIHCDGKVTATGTIDCGSKDAYSGKITVPAEANEGDVVYVSIKVTDVAGNEDEFKSQEFKIDVTNPEINVSYDNNDVSNEIYFHNKRVATVVIKEHNFDASKVKFDTTGVIGTFTSNGDIHTATVVFDKDGEHTIAVACEDIATNKSEKTTFNGVSPEKFTVDLTSPKVTITYNNNNAANGNYYKEARTATISVIETNFDANAATNGVVIKNLNNGSVPTISGWNHSGDAHTATVTFSDDAEYSIEVSFEDLATNVSEVVDPETFILDQQLPVVNISGITNNTAYHQPVVSPVITVSDDNFNVDGVVINLYGAVDGSSITLKPTSSADLGYAHRYEFGNIEVDGLYELTVQVSDLAGNMTDAYISEDGVSYEGSIQFSVNRNGSVYTLGSETKDLLNKVYANQETDIVITETNVNILTDIQIVVSKDNNQTQLADLSDLEGETLKEGEGYSVTRSNVNDGWSQYTYSISKNNFAEDGVYHISLYSVDEAGNKADLDLVDTMEMTFVIDKTAPIYIVSDLSSHTTYNTDNKEVTFSAKDNMVLSSVSVELNGEEIATWNEEEIRTMQTNNVDFTFVIPESVEEQTVMITCVDKAGNRSDSTEINKILVTTNGWVRFTHNKTLVAGTSVAASAVFVGGVSGFGIRRKRKLLKLMTK